MEHIGERGVGRTFRQMLRVAMYACSNADKEVVVINDSAASSNHASLTFSNIVHQLLMHGWAKHDNPNQSFSFNNGTRVLFRVVESRTLSGRSFDAAFIDHWVEERGLTPRGLHAKIMELGDASEAK